MENTEEQQDAYDQTFIDQPAILDKYKAAAVVADGKHNYSIAKNQISNDV